MLTRSSIETHSQPVAQGPYCNEAPRNVSDLAELVISAVRSVRPRLAARGISLAIDCIAPCPIWHVPYLAASTIGELLIEAASKARVGEDLTAHLGISNTIAELRIPSNASGSDAAPALRMPIVVS